MFSFVKSVLHLCFLIAFFLKWSKQGQLMSKSVCPCRSHCCFVQLSSWHPSSHPPRILSITNTHTCCCPWFRARPLLHRVRKHGVSDAVMWSFNVNRQNARVSHCWPGFKDSQVQGIYLHLWKFPRRFSRMFVSSQALACDWTARASLALPPTIEAPCCTDYLTFGH